MTRYSDKLYGLFEELQIRSDPTRHECTQWCWLWNLLYPGLPRVLKYGSVFGAGYLAGVAPDVRRVRRCSR